jgi:hypothetical protein
MLANRRLHSTFDFWMIVTICCDENYSRFLWTSLQFVTEIEVLKDVYFMHNLVSKTWAAGRVIFYWARARAQTAPLQADSCYTEPWWLCPCGSRDELLAARIFVTSNNKSSLSSFISSSPFVSARELTVFLDGLTATLVPQDYPKRASS